MRLQRESIYGKSLETISGQVDLSDAELEEYLDSGAWEGKAGAFGYQDRHGWIHILSGSESNVVGLPLELLQSMLQEMEQGFSPDSRGT